MERERVSVAMWTWCHVKIRKNLSCSVSRRAEENLHHKMNIFFRREEYKPCERSLVSFLSLHRGKAFFQNKWPPIEIYFMNLFDVSSLTHARKRLLLRWKKCSTWVFSVHKYTRASVSIFLGKNLHILHIHSKRRNTVKCFDDIEKMARTQQKKDYWIGSSCSLDDFVPGRIRSVDFTLHRASFSSIFHFCAFRWRQKT